MQCYICGATTEAVGSRDGVTYEACPSRCCLQCPEQPCVYPDKEDQHYWAAIGRNDNGTLHRRLDTVLHYLRTPFTALDYGCGQGHFVRFLRGRGVVTQGYDPHEPDWQTPVTGQYHLVTLLEVVEHLGPALMPTLKTLVEEHLHPGGLLYVATALWTGQRSEQWWYVGPQRGHISIISSRGIEELARQLDLEVLDHRDSILMKRR